MKPERRVLIVDDDILLCESLASLLTREGYVVRLAATVAVALETVRDEPIELTLLDLRLGAESGLDLLPRLIALRPEISVIMITAAGTIESAVEAMHLGADYFLVKPVDPPRLLAVVAKGLESRRLRTRNTQFERLAPGPSGALFSEAGPMREVLELVGTVAARETTVLLEGETGTGKSLVARRIHEASPRAKQPFVELNCGSLARELIESELFGHERGSFTGAGERKIGLFEAADGGTLFLDEVGELDTGIQVKLLGVLDRNRFRRVGGVAEIEVDVRVIAATNRDLMQDVAAGRFREDLFYRLNVFAIELPSLRDRRDEILPLALHFLRQFRGAQAPAPQIAPKIASLLETYRWPGNIRELRNVMERAAILCPPGGSIEPAHLPSMTSSLPRLPGTSGTEWRNGTGDAGLPEAPVEHAAVLDAESLREVTRRRLEDAVKIYGRNMAETARHLGISRTTLYRKLKEYKIAIEE